MGYIKHHAIVVTGWSRSDVSLAHSEALRLGCIVSPISEAGCNGVVSFAVFPDGSKEGWDESDRGDERRSALTEWMSTATGRFDYVEVSFGGDDLLAGICCASNAEDTRVVQR